MVFYGEGVVVCTYGNGLSVGVFFNSSFGVAELFLDGLCEPLFELVAVSVTFCFGYLKREAEYNALGGECVAHVWAVFKYYPEL
jgi:hypothetical protein